MTDRMRESVFSSLQDLTGTVVLDLYAGSGSLGLEALSRGATKATFVESSREAILKLEQNIEATGFEDRSDVVWADVNLVISKHATERVDLIFVDPPYSTKTNLVQSDLEALVMGGFLSDEGRVVVHRPANESSLDALGLQPIWEREFGQSKIVVFTHEEEG
jgi:16S rRNA (guanine966-N2)-methyltransferase